MLLGIVIYVVTDNGSVWFNGLDARMKVAIDGKDIEVENHDEIWVRAGKHDLVVKRDGRTVKTQAFDITRGQEIGVELPLYRTPDVAPKAIAEPGPPARIVIKNLSRARRSFSRSTPLGRHTYSPPTRPRSPTNRNRSRFTTGVPTGRTNGRK